MMEKPFRKKARIGNQAEANINVLLQANIHLIEIIQSQAEQYDCKVYKDEGKRSIEENAANVWAHFSQYMNSYERKSA